MTEIPEHLLERSKARRSALGLLKDGEATSAAVPARTADTGAAAAAPAARAAAAPEPAAIKPPEPPAPYVAAALARKKLPFWVVPVLLFLPVWVFLYPGTLERPPAAGGGILAEGQTVYNSKCSSCHGSTGGGGVGRQLSSGEVLLTFPNNSDHVWWVVNGSASAVGVGNPYGAANRPGGQHIAAGGMASWASALTAKELLSAVYYERVKLSGATVESAQSIQDLFNSADLPAHFTEGMTQADIAALFAKVAPASATAAAK